MRKLQIILLIIIIIGLGLLFTQKFWVDHFVQFILTHERVARGADPTNTTYTISGKEYALVNGKVEKEIPNSSSKEVVQLFGKPVFGDLDKDGDEDFAMWLVQQTGGSGTFFYVVEAINNDGVYKGTNAMFVGDRIAPQNINIIDGRAVANFADRKPEESFAVSPSIGKSIWVHLDVQKNEIGEWVKDFEGESNLE
jgi:hypothetical protein